MSIYSGFATRKDESRYNDLLSRLLLLLQQHLLELCGPQLTPQRSLAYTKLITKMRDYEEHKYLPPKFSTLLAPLCNLIGIPCEDEAHIPAEHENKPLGLQRLKSTAQSKGRRINTESAEPRIKKNPFNDHHRPNETPGTIKRTLFQSTDQLRERNFNPNLSREDPLSHPDHNLSREETLKIQTGDDSNISNSHPLIFSAKNKSNISNMRYRAYQALAVAQENGQKGQIPLREQMRRQLKTSVEYSGGEM